MLFQRRTPADLHERLRIAVWPRRSFGRSLRYFAKRALRLSATPHAVAAGVASGVFIAFTPFLGAHLILAALVAWLLQGNIVASALGTAFGNPLTLPLIWAATYELGLLILGRPMSSGTPHIADALGHFDLTRLWGPILEPMTIGSLPLGALFGLGFYFATRWGVAAFQRQRHARLVERARRGRPPSIDAALPG